MWCEMNSIFQIKYVADPDGGFRILEGSSLDMRPKDTVAVKKAKEEHEALFKKIAQRNEYQPGMIMWYEYNTYTVIEK